MIIYVVVWHEAVEVSDLIACAFLNEADATALHESLVSQSSGDYWEVVPTEVK